MSSVKFPPRSACGLVILAFLLALLPAGRAQSILINEVMSSNGSTLQDENGDSSDWLEIYNPGDAEVSLSGWALSDSTNLWKWRFADATIAPREFLVVFASNKDRQPVSVGAVHPTNYPGLKLWLSADAVQASDPAQARVSGANVFVKNWLDQSGSNHPAQQTVDASQPQWVASVPELGNRPALRFDGTNDQLLLPAVLARNQFTLIAMARSFTAHEVDAQETVGVGGVSGQRYLFGAQHGGDYQAGAGVSMGTNGVTVYEHGSGYMPALAVGSAWLPGFTVVSVNYSNRQPSLFSARQLGGVRVCLGPD